MATAHNSNKALNLKLIETQLNGSVQETSLNELQVLTIKPGATYSIVDVSTMQPVQGLQLKRKDNTLEIEVDQEVVVILNEFYADDSFAIFSLDGSAAPSDSMAVRSTDSANTAQGDVIWQADSDPDSISFTTLVGAVGLAAAGAAIASSSDKDSDDAGQTTSGSYDITIAVAAGPFLSVTTIELYDKDGNALISREHDFSTGDLTLTITNGYSGPVFAKVIDANGDEGDYRDETSGELVSLGSDLRAMSSVDGTSDVHISITPLTELAVIKAGISDDNIVTEENVTVNEQIAEIFGIEDITAPVVTVLEGGYQADDGISAQEHYGNVLAQLSGADQVSGSIAETLEALAQTIIIEDGQVSITQEGVDLIAEGTEKFELGANADKADLTETLIEAPIIDTTAPTAPVIALGNDTGTDAITNDGSFTVTGTEVDATIEYSTDGANWSETKPAAVEGENNIQARQTDVAGNVSDVATLTFSLDTTAAAPVIALDNDTGTATGADTDAITSDGSFTVTGTEVDATVEYSTDGANWSETKPAAVEGENSIQVRQTDVAGNVSDVATLTFTLDTTAPTTAPVITLDNDTGTATGADTDAITSDGSFTVTDTEVDATVEYSTDGANWSETKPQAVEGENSIQARQTDVAGNVSDVATLAFTLDTTAPTTAPVIALDNDTGTATGADTDAITNDGSFTVTGTDVDATVEYSIDGSTWSETKPQAAEGENSIQVRQTDVAGNVSEATTLTFTLDSTAAAPVIALDNDTGIGTDAITNDGSFTVTGTDTNATVEYSTDGANWSETKPAAVEGSNSIQVRQTDAAGNVSDVATLTFTLDTTAPTAAPDITLDNDTGNSTDAITTDGTYSVTATEAGATIEYSTDSGSTWSTDKPEAVEGVNSIQARQIDVAGNASAATTLDFTLLDTTAAAPVIALDNDTGIGTDAITNDGSYTVTGTEDGATVEYSIDGTSWSAAKPDLVEGANNIQVRQTDLAGNVSDASTLAFTLDTLAPATPLVSLNEDTANGSDDITSDGTYSATVTETGAVIEYSTDGTTWSESKPAAVEGANNIQVRQKDVAGNVSEVATLNFTLDTTTSAAPDIALDNDTANSSDNITSDGAYSVTATDAIVEYSTNNGTTWSTTKPTAAEGANSIQVRQTDVAGNISDVSTLNVTLDTAVPTAPVVSVDNTSTTGNYLVTATETDATIEYSIDSGTSWSTNKPAAVEGENSILVRQSDVAGNTSNATTLNFTYVNTTVLAAPTVGLDNDTGQASDNITNDGAYSVTGTDATVEYSTDSGTTWSIVKPDVVEGVNSIQVRQIDVNGNVSSASELIFTLDTTPVTAPTITLDNDTGTGANASTDSITNNGAFTVVKTDTDGVVEYSTDGTNWSISKPTAVEGENTIQVRQIDVAGNVSSTSELTFTLDTVVPGAPTITLDVDSGSDTSDSNTNNGAYTVTGVATGATVEYSTNGSTWTTTQPTAAEGINNIQARQVDAAGNVSEASALLFTLDSTAPTALTISLDNDTGSGTDGITSDGAYTALGAEAGATIEYSTDGTTWSTTKPSATEGENLIQVRQVDVVGNASAPTTLNFTFDSSAPALNSVSIASDNADPAIAKIGDTVTLTFTTDGTHSGTPSATIDGSVVTVLATNNANEYTATYIMRDPGDGNSLSFSISAADAAGNITPVTAVTDNSRVSFDALPPIDDGSVALVSPKSVVQKAAQRVSTLADNEFINDDGYFIKEYDQDWSITSITRNLDDSDGKVATQVMDGDVVVAYTYTNEDGVEYTYDVDETGAVTSYSELWTQEGSGDGTASYRYDYDAAGNFISYNYSDGTKTVDYNAQGAVQSSTIKAGSLEDLGDGNYGYTDDFGVITLFSDAEGVNLTGYITNESWDGGSETAQYDASWNLISSEITEGGETTYFDSNWQETGRTTDFSTMEGTIDGDYTVYTQTNDWGGETIQYVLTATGELDKYEETNTDSYTYTNWENKEVVSTYTNTQTFSADGNLISEKGESSESVNGESDGTYSYGTTYNYDETGTLTGYSASNVWSDSYGSGSSTSEYDANWNELSSSGTSTYTYTYTDQSGAEQTETNTNTYSTVNNDDGSYTTTYSWDGGSETTEYDANWNMISSSVTEGSKTTEYDSNWNETSSSTDFNELVGTESGDYTTYTESDNWGGETTYYVLTATGELDRYEETYSDSYTYTNWNNEEITSTYTSVYTFDGDGNELGNSSINVDSNGSTSSYISTVNYDDNGNVTGYSDASTWSDEYSSGSWTSVQDADGNEISNSGSNSYFYIDENEEQQTESSSYSTAFNIDGTYTTTNTWNDGSEITQYDENWNMISTSITEGSQTTDYDSDWNVTSSSTDFSAMTGTENGDYTTYTEADNWGGEVTYYVLTATGELEKYEESYNGSYTYTNWDGTQITSSYTNVRTFDAQGKELSDSSTNIDNNGSSNSYTSTVNYDENGNVTGYTNSNEWSDNYGSGTSISEQDANWNEISSSGTNSYTYFDENGVEQTGTSSYSTTHNDDGTHTSSSSWDGGSEITEYDANWNMISNTVTEGSKTTVYDSNWNVASSSTDFNEMEGVINGDYTVYSEADSWGGETIYYVLTATGELDKYEETDSGTYSYINWDGTEVTSSYTNIYTYDADGKELGSNNINEESNGSINTYISTVNYDDSGAVAGYTSSNEWSNEYGSGSWSSVQDANGNEISSSGTDTYTYFDENGEQQTESNSYSTTNNADGTFTTSNTWNEGSETTEYDANWNMISRSVTEGGKTTVYDADWNVTDTNINFGDMNGSVVGDYTVYTESDSWGGETTYYVVTATDALERYEQSNSDTYTYTDWQGQEITSEYTNTYFYDADGNELGYSSTNSNSDGSTNTNSSTPNYDENGELTGYTNVNQWSDQNGSGASITVFDTQWNELSNSYESTYIDESGVEQTNANTYSTTYNYDENEVLIGYTTVSDWADSYGSGSSTNEYDANDNELSNSGSNSYSYTDENGVTQTESSNYSNVNIYDENGQLTGHTNSYDWSGPYGTGLSTSEYDANWNIISESNEGSSTYVDEAGIEQAYSYSSTTQTHYNEEGVITGYTTSSEDTDSFGNGHSSTYEYDANWTVVSSSITQGSTTTKYDRDGNVTESSSDFTGKTGTENGIYTEYTEINNYGDETTYFVVTATGELERYEETSAGSYSYTDWQGKDVTVDYESTRIYNGNGQELGYRESTTDSNNGQNSYSSEPNYDTNGVLTGYTNTNEWSDGYSSNSSASEYDANWNMLSETYTGTDSYQDETGVEQTNTYTGTTVTNYDDNGAVIGYTTSNEWSDSNGGSGSSVSEYDANWNFIGGTEPEPTPDQYTTVYDDDGIVIGYVESYEWSDDYGSGSSTYEYDANWKMISETHTDTYIDDMGEEQTHTYNHSTVENVDANGELLGYTEISEWSDAYGNGTDTVEYDANWNMISETYTGIDSYEDDAGAPQTETYNEHIVAIIDENGDITGYTATETWSDTEGFAGTDTAEYDANENMISGEYVYTDADGNEFSGVFTETETEILDSTGAIIGYTETETWNGTDGSGSEIEEYDANWNLIGASMTEDGVTTYYDGQWNIIDPDLVDGTQPDSGDTNDYTYQSETVDNYDQDNILIGYTQTTTWSDAYGSGVDTEQYNLENQLISATYTGVDIYQDDSGVLQTESYSEQVIAIVDANGDITGYTVTETWSDTEGDTFTTTAEYDADENMISGEYVHTDAAGDVFTGVFTETETENVDANGVLIGYTETLTWSGTDGSGSEVEVFDANWNLISASMTENGVTTYYDNEWNTIDSSTEGTDVEQSIVEFDLSIVEFDLTNGSSSEHSNQTFAEDVSYTIYIKVDQSSELSTGLNDITWSGGSNLGADDTVMLVGNDVETQEPWIFDATATAQAIEWSSEMSVALLNDNGEFVMNDLSDGSSVDSLTGVDLWTGTWTATPNYDNTVLPVDQLAPLQDDMTV